MCRETSTPPGVVLAGAQHHMVPLRPENDFLIPLDDLPPDVRDRMRMLVLNYPNNPTTAEAPVEYLEEAVAFCRDRGAALVHDHAYSEVAFDGYRPPSALQVQTATRCLGDDGHLEAMREAQNKLAARNIMMANPLDFNDAGNPNCNYSPQISTVGVS